MTTHHDDHWCRHGRTGICADCRADASEAEERRLRVLHQLDAAVDVKLAERIQPAYPDLTPRAIYSAWLERTGQ